MGVGLSIELPEVLKDIQTCEIALLKLGSVYLPLLSAGPWSKVTNVLDTFIIDEYSFLLENIDVENLTGMSSTEVVALAGVVCRRPRTK